jgi:hypothetical protein
MGTSSDSKMKKDQKDKKPAGRRNSVGGTGARYTRSKQARARGNKDEGRARQARWRRHGPRAPLARKQGPRWAARVGLEEQAGAGRGVRGGRREETGEGRVAGQEGPCGVVGRQVPSAREDGRLHVGGVADGADAAEGEERGKEPEDVNVEAPLDVGRLDRRVRHVHLDLGFLARVDHQPDCTPAPARATVSRASASAHPSSSRAPQ